MAGTGSPTELQGSLTSFIQGVVTVPPNEMILAGAGGQGGAQPGGPQACTESSAPKHCWGRGHPGPGRSSPQRAGDPSVSPLPGTASCRVPVPPVPFPAGSMVTFSLMLPRPAEVTAATQSMYCCPRCRWAMR